MGMYNLQLVDCHSVVLVYQAVHVSVVNLLNRANEGGLNPDLLLILRVVPVLWMA